MRFQQHKMSLPAFPTSTLVIILNWVQRTGQILRHSEKVLQIVQRGGGDRHGWGNGENLCARCLLGALIPPPQWKNCLLLICGAQLKEMMD